MLTTSSGRYWGVCFYGEIMEYKDFDNRDTCLQVSHYIWSKIVLNKSCSYEDATILYKMKYDECRLNKILGNRKNRAYRWSNSDGLTKWLYDNVLKYISLNPYKGLNSDQYRAYFLMLTEIYSLTKYQLPTNIVLGFILRFGFTPSLMEHFLLKTQAYVLLLRSFKRYYLNPLYWLSLLAFHFSMKRNLAQPIKGHTTNKISMIPTMHYLGYKIPDKEYTDEVYNRYYGEGTELCEVMKKAVDKLRDL